eukprot:11411558-Alexandrium_andersonii.AAC.1
MSRILRGKTRVEEVRICGTTNSQAPLRNPRIRNLRAPLRLARAGPVLMTTEKRCLPSASAG